MMDGQQQTSRRAAARVKPYRLEHGPALSREPPGRSLCFFYLLLPAPIIVKPAYVDGAQARFGTHRTLRLHFQAPLFPALLCAGETQAQRIVMIEYGLQSAQQMPALQIGRDLQHNRLAEALQRAA